MRGQRALNEVYGTLDLSHEWEVTERLLKMVPNDYYRK